MADASFNHTKMLWFFIKRLTIFLIVVLIGFYVYFTALNITNVYVVASDGMHEIAAQALMQNESTELSNYFSQKIIDDKQYLLTQEYSDCTIWDFKYKLKIEPFICLPISRSITITATETINEIDGQAKKVDGVEQSIPAWDNAKYKITLSKNSKDQWIITNINKIEDLQDTSSTATPKTVTTASPKASN